MSTNLETYKELFETLLTEKDSVNAEPGSLIYSSKHQSGQLILIESGEVRIIDPSRTFGSHTLLKVQAPAIFGISQIISVPFVEEIRASTRCQYYLANLNKLSNQQHVLAENSLRQQISPYEIAQIYEDGQEALSRFDHYSEAREGIVFLAKGDKLIAMKRSFISTMSVMASHMVKE